MAESNHFKQQSDGCLDSCTSSFAIRISSITFEKTVGSMKKPFLPSDLPPHSSFAPSVMPLSTSSRTLSHCSLSIWKEIKSFRAAIHHRRPNDCSIWHDITPDPTSWCVQKFFISFRNIKWCIVYNIPEKKKHWKNKTALFRFTINSYEYSTEKIKKYYIKL